MRLGNEALKAQHKVARGKCAAKRSALPLDQTGTTNRALKGRYTVTILASPFSRPFRLDPFARGIQGRRAPLRFALAPGYLMLRLQRFTCQNNTARCES